jgi:SAM-dependent methyltransferase
VTNDRGQPREGMAHKFRQIEKFAELLHALLAESGLAPALSGSTLPAPCYPPLRIADMGAGKGYLTFALADLLRERAEVLGIERRADLVAVCNRVASDSGLAPKLRFVEGDIPSSASAATTSLGQLDALIALHACDTATDDALAAGHASGARLLVVSPCCQKELRPRLVAPPVLADALRHGIFLERQAEFVTDALRAQLLEAAGYRTKVFEFVATEHTAKNLMIAAVRPAALAACGAVFEPDPAALDRARAFAAFYGIREQRLARHLGIDLA